MVYRRVGLEEREEISRFLSSGFSFREIGRRLNRSASTISREVNRCSRGRDYYRAYSGNRQSNRKASSRRHAKRKLVLNPRLLKVVKLKLRERWSPEQIAYFLRSR